MININSSEIDELIEFFNNAANNATNLNTNGQSVINQYLSQVLPHTLIEVNNGIVPFASKLAYLKLREVQTVPQVRQVYQAPQKQYPEQPQEGEEKGNNNLKIFMADIAEVIIKAVFKSAH